MDARSYIVLVLLLGWDQLVFAEPKAYELVKYRGKVNGLTIEFDFGAGYSEASEVRIKQGRRVKIARFILAEGDRMLFVPKKQRMNGEEITLQMSSLDDPKEKVQGTYWVHGRTTRFTLTQLQE
jgi:hypothetical protein